MTYSSAGDDKIAVFPTPASSGDEILLSYVYRPAALDSGTDEPACPEEFHRAIVDYASSVRFGAIEDNPELEAFYFDKFERKVAQLGALRLTRGGSQIAQMRVEGIHY